MKLFPGGGEHPGVLAMVLGSPPLSPRNIVLCVCALAEGGVREMMEGWSAHCQNVGLRGHQYDQLHLIWLKGPRVLEGGDRSMRTPHPGSEQREARPPQDFQAPSHLEDTTVSCRRATSVSQMSGTCKTSHVKPDGANASPRAC